MTTPLAFRGATYYVQGMTEARTILKTVRVSPETDRRIKSNALEFSSLVDRLVRGHLDGLEGRFDARDGSEVGRGTQSDCRGSQEAKQ